MKKITIPFKNLKKSISINYLIADLVKKNSSGKFIIKYESTDEFTVNIGSNIILNSESEQKDNSNNYKSLIEYFKGLIILKESGEVVIDYEVEIYYAFDSTSFDSDELIDLVFENSHNEILNSIRRTSDILIYKFKDIDNIHVIDYHDEDYEILEEDDVAYEFFIASFKKYPNGSFLDYEEYTQSQYSEDIESFKKVLSYYTKKNVFDSDYTRDRVMEDESIFSSYEEYENRDEGVYSSIIGKLYKEGKIPLTLKNDLLEVSEEDYDKLIEEFRRNIYVSYDKPNNEQNYIIDSHYETMSYIYIEKDDFKDWDKKYNTSEWLTEDILNDLIRETKSQLDINYLWDAYDNRYLSKRYDYQQDDIYINCHVYIGYDDIMNSISEITLSPLNRKSGKIGKIANLLTSETNPDKDKQITSYEKKIQDIKDNTYYRIASLLGKHLDYDLNKVITLKDFKKIANSDEYLKRLLTTKSGTNLLNTFNKGFSIENLKKINTPVYEKGSLFEFFTEERNVKLDDLLSVDVVSYKWKSSLQTITNKYNYVFQLNFNKKYYEELLTNFDIPEINKEALGNYHKTKHTLHPVQNNEKFISLGWIRYTVNPTIKFNDTELDGVLLDEVQSDLDNFEYLGRDIMKGWQNIIVRKFISYVKKNLGYSKIYMPNADIKADEYHAFQRKGGKGSEIVQKYTANLLYKQLPNSFAFLPSEIEGFYLLESKKRSIRNLIIER